MKNQLESYTKFWGYQQNRDVYNLFKDGATVNDIATALSIRPDTVINTITNDEFRRRMDKYLAAKVYMHQTASIIALDETTKKLWDRVKNTIDQIPPEVCLKELTRLISQNSKSPKVINPKQYNVTFNDMQDPEKVKQILGPIVEDNFGFEPLPDKPDSEYEDELTTTPQP